MLSPDLDKIDLGGRGDRIVRSSRVSRKTGWTLSFGGRRIDSTKLAVYKGGGIRRVDPLNGGGVAEWLKAAVC
jgi:hypothetical protein